MMFRRFFLWLMPFFFAVAAQGSELNGNYTCSFSVGEGVSGQITRVAGKASLLIVNSSHDGLITSEFICDGLVCLKLAAFSDADVMLEGLAFAPDLKSVTKFSSAFLPDDVMKPLAVHNVGGAMDAEEYKPINCQHL